MNAALKILIVEDTPADAELAAAMLGRTWPQLEWRRVETATAFRTALQWQPDLIIADYEVPGFGAIAALAILQELGTDIPLIVFTGAVDEETVVRCMRLGAADYLLKDRLTRLTAAVENALVRYRERAERLRTEAAQQRLATLNSAILNSLPAQVALLDDEGRIVAVNQAWERYGLPCGFTDPAWVVGTPYADACEQTGNEQAGEIARGVRSVLAGQLDTFTLEYPCHAPTEKRWYRLVLSRIGADSTAAARGGAVVMHLNVTDRKLAEEKIRINANALRQLTEAVVITDAQLRVVTVNKAFTSMMGYQGREVLGEPLSQLIARDYPETLLDDIRAAVVRGRAWTGELQSRRKSGEVFPALLSFSAVRSDSGEVEFFTAVLTDLSSVREVERRIEYLSQHDALTGLPNRTALADRIQALIERAKQDGTTPALLMVELDRFKTVNDTLGHVAGDELIKAAAERLRELADESDVLARLGGDEFVLLTVFADAEEIQSGAEILRRAFEHPFSVQGQEVFITASIGVSCFPVDGEDAESLLRAADTAVYRAKNLGRNTVSFFAAEMNEAARERFELQNRLPQALARDEFVLAYQPTVDLQSGKVTGVEALLRWNHPQLGLIAPTKFIGLAEDTGLIIPIEEWVLRTVCAQLKQWVSLGWKQAGAAVNLSVRQFMQPDLARRITDVLTSTGLEAKRLRLEVTESMVMNDPVAAGRALADLAAAGIETALDDFGTGYSSLGYLKRFRLRCLKVDRSFVNGTPGDVGDESIVRAVIALGKTMGMRVVAEGVETLAQAHFLSDTGCDDAKGFWYSKPVGAEQILPLTVSIPDKHRLYVSRGKSSFPGAQQGALF